MAASALGSRPEPKLPFADRRKVRSVSIKSYGLGDTPNRIFRGPNGVEMMEQKEQFMNHGQLPDFSRFDTAKVEKARAKGEIRFEYLPLAKRVLSLVREHHTNGDRLMTAAFGEPISKQQATALIRRYLDADPILAGIKVIWSEDINCSAVMITRAIPNQMEKAKYTLALKDDGSNPYLRERGIQALCNHEVGTHFVRFYNEALQPWCASRRRFKLRKRSTLAGVHTEEGLASVASLLPARVKLLYKAAVHYYAACMAAVMPFRELYDHLQGLEPEPDNRWRLVYRIKRSLTSDQLGGYGKDQCYFGGAVKILLNRRKLNFSLLFAGKLCYDEVDRVRRVVRMEGTLKPPYMQNMAEYMRHLDEISNVNEIDQCYPSFLQCPTIRVPAPILNLDPAAPLDFLPLTQRRRDELSRPSQGSQLLTGTENTISKSTGETEEPGSNVTGQSKDTVDQSGSRKLKSAKLANHKRLSLPTSESSNQRQSSALPKIGSSSGSSQSSILSYRINENG